MTYVKWYTLKLSIVYLLLSMRRNSVQLEVEKIYSGFIVLRKEYVEEQDAICYELEHLQSGARLLYVAAEDDNKVFSICFRTPAFDDTGVAHIMEHSVLCGSKKYRLKEPFVELVKGSMNTFLNAMTYPDKTIYPVASRNAKDFDNLMDVYLDAVFNPLVYENPYTLKQEGWHYEIDSRDTQLEYNGVVYNEMKGVYSNPDSYLDRVVMQNLFPDNTYHYESGGYPESIPELTQEQFLNFHRKYYSPENSKIFLYGDLDIENALKHISEGYLNNYQRTDAINTSVVAQTPLTKTKDVVEVYPEVSNAKADNKVYHELSIAVNRNVDRKDLIALKLLSGVLVSSDSGPLKRALIEARVGQNIVGHFETSLLQPVFSIRASGSTLEKRDEFISIVYRELQKVSREGVNKELLEGGLNTAEFKLRENEHDGYPRGLMLCLAAMDEWNYDLDPIETLRYKQVFKELREGLKTNYYEGLIETYLLDNTHKVFVTLKPEAGKVEQTQAELNLKLEGIKSRMSSEEVDRCILECEELHRRQSATDSPENLATIPVLKLSDIRREPEQIDRIIKSWDSNTEIYVSQKTNGIAYLSWAFDVTNISKDDLQYLSLLCLLLGKMNSENYSYQDLEKLGLLYTGGMVIHPIPVTKRDDADEYKIYVKVTGKCLVENLDKFYMLLEEVICRTKFDDKQRFREIVEETKISMDESFFSVGRDVAVSRLRSYLSKSARVSDLFDRKLFVDDLYNHFDEKVDITLQKMQSLCRKIFTREKVVITCSCDEADRDKITTSMREFVAEFPLNTLGGNCPDVITMDSDNEAITCAGTVQYVVVGGNYRRKGFDYTGAMMVLKNILSYEYLWINIRVKGGAYGAFANFTSNGYIDFSTYRDPQLVQSMEVLKSIPEWLKGLELSRRELDKYVIGTMSNLDHPMTKEHKMQVAEDRYLNGTTMEMVQKVRNQVLDVTMDDLHSLGDVIEKTFDEAHYCVVGSKEVIEAHSELFGRVVES